MAEGFECDRATVVTRNKRIAWFAATPFVATVLSIAAGALVSPRFFGVTILSFLVGALLSGVVHLLDPLPTRDASGVVADQRGLRTRAGMSLARGSFTEGAVDAPGPDGGVTVRLRRKGLGSAVSVAVPSADEGGRLLEALRLDPSHSVASFFGMSRTYASWGGFVANTALLFLGPVGLGMAAGVLHSSFLGLAAAVVGVVAYVSFFMPMRLQVGGDGVIVSWYGRRRFLPYAELDAVTVRAGLWPSIRSVVLRLRGGEEVTVPLGYGFFGRPDAAAERLRSAMEAYAVGDRAGDAAILARGERTPSEWLRALRQLGSGASAGHRTSALTPDALWRVVEEVGGKPTARVAAAVALSPTLTDDDRARLAAVAEGATAPKLRIALEAAATSEDDAALSEALEELDAEERARPS